MLTLMLASPDRLALDALTFAVQLQPPVDYLAWAEREIVFDGRGNPFPGPYNRQQFPHFDAILRALGPDDPCRTVTLVCSAQIGKTTIANIFTLGTMAMDPGDFLYVHPTDDNGRRWSKMKLRPMLRTTGCLDGVFPERSRDGSDSVMYKERADGRGAIQISGANSPASLSQVSMRRQVQDDLSKWEMNLAGDPEAQADSRSQAFEFAKIFKISTPLIEPGCRITANFEAGTRERPYVPCPHCAHSHVLEWDTMLAHLDPEAPELAHFVCPQCGGVIEEHHRSAMLKGVEWVADNPAAMRIHRSFWLWSAYSPLMSWELIARRWLSSQGDPATEQTFLNDVIGRAYKAKGEAVPWEKLRDRGAESSYPRATVPADAVVLTLGIDCQSDRVEWQLVGWGRRHRRWVIEAGVYPGHISDDRTRTLLDGLLAARWMSELGCPLSLDLAAIDGNAWTEEVWGWVRNHSAGRVIMVRGVATETAPLIARVKRERAKSGKLLKYSGRFYNFATSVLKMRLYRNLAKEDLNVAGAVQFPRGLEDEFYRQITAERRVPVKNKQGFTVWQWTKDPAQANEMLDTHLQAEAAAIRYGVPGFTDAIWDKFEAERQSLPSADEQPQPQPPVPPAAVITSAPLVPHEPPVSRVRTLARRLA